MVWDWTSRQARRQGRRVTMLAALLIGSGLGAPAVAQTVVDVRAAGDQVVIRFDAPVADAAARVLDASRQIAVDVAGALPGHGGDAAGAVRAVSQARTGAGARVLLDLARPEVIADGGFDAAGQVLTLTLQPAGAAAFAAAGTAAPFRFFPFDLSGWSRPKYKVVQAVPAPTRTEPLPHPRGEAGKPLVVIDAGHGGMDPGAINPVTGLKEKDLTLKIAKAIRDQLVASGRVRVALTREDDRYLVLRERFGIARRLHADLFMSIHCDSVGAGNGASGASVYTLSEVASDKEAARLALRENKADIIDGVDLDGAGADVQSILIDLTQRETMNRSADFARVLGREAKPLMPVKPDFHRMASLMVLKAPDMPSVLFETGYISNPADAAFLNSDEGRQRIAESVTHAVEVHFARRMAAR